MKLLMLLLFSATVFITQPAGAHGDHEHSMEPRLVSESVAFLIAQRAAASLTEKDAGLGFGQLKESWSAIPARDLEVHKQGRGYYVISVLNESEERKLYVLMSGTGRVYDANMTGEFDGIE